MAHNLQVVIDSALVFLQIRSDDGETPNSNRFVLSSATSIDGVNVSIDSIIAATHITAPVNHIRQLLLDEARNLKQLARLFGLDEARQIFKSEYDLNVDKVKDVANFRDKYVRGHFQSGCTELLWAAEKYGIYWVIVSRVNGFSVSGSNWNFLKFSGRLPH